MKFFFGGLNRQILMLTMGVVMAATVIIGLLALLVFYQYSKEQVLADNLETARDVSRELDDFIEHCLETTKQIADDPSISDFDPSWTQDEIARLFKVSGEFDGMSLINRQGRLVAFMPPSPNAVGLDLSKRNYVQAVLKDGRSFISEPYTARTGNDVVVVASPVRDKDGKIIGLVSGSINLKTNSTISRIASAKVQDSSMIIQVISRSGQIIYHPDRNKLMQKAAINPIIEDVLEGKQGTKLTEINSEPYLTGYSPVPGSGWGVIVEYPAKAALRSVTYLRNLMFLITALICILVFFVTYLQSKALVKPLGKLMDGVRKVAEGDYHINVDVKSQNEIGVLASSFNSMVERIKTMREDILEKKEDLEKANIELQVMAITDGLTKLYNHRYFQDCLEKAVAYAQQENKSMTLMILDIDHFKYYNDLFGHQAGDRLLEELAQLLIRELGPNDMVARYGGEEFTVILYDSDNRHGIEVAETIRSAVEAFPFPGREQQPEGKVTVSIGVASYPENARTKEELVKLADEALYKAKCCSRNKVELYFSVLDDLKKDLDQSEVDLINSIKMLIRIINAKDMYTYGHSERVGRYAVWIAEKMGLPEDEIKTIKMGAFLHDIGKIEVSRGILMKKGPLVDEEYEVVKKHPFWGAGIIKAVESLNQTLPIIKYHHERFDGSGYPKGLKAKQIPLHARIMAVADSFDAMTTNRPYRKRKNIPEAIEEMKRCSGTQFDPEIVQAFVCVLQEQQEKVG